MKGQIGNIQAKTTQKGKPWWTLTINGEQITTFDKNAGTLQAGDMLEFNTKKSDDGRFTNLQPGWKKITEINGKDRAIMLEVALKGAIASVDVVMRTSPPSPDHEDASVTNDFICGLIAKNTDRFFKGLLKLYKQDDGVEAVSEPEPREPDETAEEE